MAAELHAAVARRVAGSVPQPDAVLDHVIGLDQVGEARIDDRQQAVRDHFRVERLPCVMAA